MEKEAYSFFDEARMDLIRTRTKRIVLIAVSATILFAVILFLLLFFQSREWMMLFVVFLAVFTCLYLMFLLFLFKEMLSPLISEKKVAERLKKNPKREPLAGTIDEKGEHPETLNGILCSYYLMVGEDGKRRKVFVPLELDPNISSGTRVTVTLLSGFLITLEIAG